MAWRRRYRSDEVPYPPEPRPTVRVLHGEAELAEAAERAADGERRLRARLEARARHEAERDQPSSDRSVIPWADTLRGRREMPPRTPAA